MAISPDRVRDIFKGLETGDGAAFFERVRTYLDSALMARLFEENPIDLPRQAAARASGESRGS